MAGLRSRGLGSGDFSSRDLSSKELWTELLALALWHAGWMRLSMGRMNGRGER